MEQFYILEDGHKQGPFDLVSMIKKIRNGRLTPTHQVITQNMESPQVAAEFTILQEYFNEAPKEPQSTDDKLRDAIDFKRLLATSWEEYGQIQQSSIVIALGLMAQMVLGIFFSAILPESIAMILIGALFGASVFIATLVIDQLLLTRRVDVEMLQSLRNGPGLRLLASGAALGTVCFGLPLVLVFALGPLAILLLLLGFMVFGLFFAVPLIWKQENAALSPQIAFQRSLSWVMSYDRESLAILLSIAALNCVAALLFLFPIFISLPVTLIALISLFNQSEFASAPHGNR